MDLEEIKDIIEKEGAKIVIVEADKPRFVILPFEEWRRGRSSAAERPQSMQPANPPAPKEAGEAGRADTEGLTIDDLPL